jgi:peptidoglycan hydrolase-like protein with peptidoglycan-binding domain
MKIFVDGVVVQDMSLWLDSHDAQKQPRTIDITPFVLSGTSMRCPIDGIRQGTRFGDQGEFVKRLQDFLKCAGTLAQDAPASGVFGLVLQKALQEFQRVQGLVPQTGSVGPRTLETIRSFGASL